MKADDIRMSLRLPRALKPKIAKIANNESRSINSQLVVFITESIERYEANCKP